MALQALLSMGFSRQEYWVAISFSNYLGAFNIFRPIFEFKDLSKCMHACTNTIKKKGSSFILYAVFWEGVSPCPSCIGQVSDYTGELLRTLKANVINKTEAQRTPRNPLAFFVFSSFFLYLTFLNVYFN